MKESSVYKEIFKLKRMLEKEGIPFVFLDRSCRLPIMSSIFPDGEGALETYQILYPASEKETRWISVIEGFGTYGEEKDRLEIMGGQTPQEQFEDVGPVIGYLTARNVFKRIKEHYKLTLKLEGKDEEEK